MEIQRFRETIYKSITALYKCNNTIQARDITRTLRCCFPCEMLNILKLS